MREKVKEVVVVSGKGGTGKTSLTAAFSHLAAKKHKIITVDCDVDAADLYILMDPDIIEKKDFISGYEAIIDQGVCTKCKICLKNCKFKAVKENFQGKIEIDLSYCQGCGVCEFFCPEKAISLKDRLCGEWFISETKLGFLIHSQLSPQGENSGKLVSLLRSKARDISRNIGVNLIISDGPPGIGCPVIASITNSDAVVIVTEPSLSGLNDFLRILTLTKNFGMPAYVIVNKSNINHAITEIIRKKSEELNSIFLGCLYYSEDFVSAQMTGRNIIEYNCDSDISNRVKEIWEKLCQKINP